MLNLSNKLLSLLLITFLVAVSFFSGEANFLQGSGYGARRDVVIPKFSHLSGGFVAMLLGKSLEFVPVGNLVVMTRWAIRFREEVSGVFFSLQPEIDSVPAEMEKLTGFGFGHTV